MLNLKTKYESSCREGYNANRRLVWIILWIVLLIIVAWILGCTSEKQIVPSRYENQLIITKKYYGRVLHTKVNEKYTLVVMEYGYCELVGQVIVPEGSQGYIRTEPCYQDVHPQIRARLERKYFSWDDKEYKIKTW